MIYHTAQKALGGALARVRTVGYRTDRNLGKTEKGKRLLLPCFRLPKFRANWRSLERHSNFSLIFSRTLSKGPKKGKRVIFTFFGYTNFEYTTLGLPKFRLIR